MGLADVVAIFRADSSQFTAKLGEMNVEMDKLGKSGASNFEKMGSMGGAALMGIGAAAVGVGIVAVDLAEKFDVAHASLMAAFTAAGISAAQAKGPISAVDSAMEKFGYTNAETEGAVSKLVVAHQPLNKIMGDTTLAANIAAQRHTDLSTAMTIVTKAAEGNVGALKRMGIDLPIAAGGAAKVTAAQNGLASAQDKVNAILLKTPDAMNPASKAHAAYEAAIGKVAAAHQKLTDAQTAGGTILEQLSGRFSGQAASAADTFGGKLKVAKAMAEDLGAKLGEKLIPVLENLMKKIEGVVTWFEKHKAVAEAVGIAVVVAVGAMIVAWAAGAIAAMAFWTAASGGIVILVAALAIGIAWIVTHWSTIAAFFVGIWNDVKNAFTTAWNAIASFLSGIWSAITSGIHTAWSTIANFFTGLWATIIGAIHTAWSTVANFFTGLWTTISGAITAAWNHEVSFFTGIWTTISAAITAAWNAIASFFTGIWTTISGAIEAAWNHEVAFFAGIWTTISSAISSAWNAIVGVFTGVWSTISSGITTAWNAVVSFLSGTWSKISGDITAAWNAIVDFFSGIPGKIKAFFSDAISWLIQAGTDILTGLWNAVKAAWTALGDIGNTVKGWITAGLSAAGTWLVDTGIAIIQGLWNGITSMAQKAADAVGNVVTGAIKAGKKLLGVGSPSKVFHEIGMNIGQGLANGINTGAPLAVDAISKMARSLSQPIGASVLMSGSASGIPGLNTPNANTSGQLGTSGPGGGGSVTFAPVYNISGTPESMLRQMQDLIDQGNQKLDHLIKARGR
jgi:phage-related protein